MKYMSVEDLQVTDKMDNTVMSYAALYGYTHIVKCLYEKDKNLVAWQRNIHPPACLIYLQSLALLRCHARSCAEDGPLC